MEALRRKGYTGKLTWQPERSAPRPPAHLSTLDTGFVLGDPAVSLDVTTHAVTTASGRVLAADALALRADLLSCQRVVVVGDGVLGWTMPKQARQHRQELVGGKS